MILENNLYLIVELLDDLQNGLKRKTEKKKFSEKINEPSKNALKDQKCYFIQMFS